MVITMTNEDTAWEQFSKADAANIGDASAVGMLQAIMAELNSIKEDTARLEQKIDGGAGEPPMDAGMPPMDEGAPAEMPPMDAGMPPADAEGSLAGEGTIPTPSADETTASAATGDIFSDNWAEDEPEDETLSALQDALSVVTDPEAIVKLADIIKEYVSKNAPVEEAPLPEVAEEPIPEEVVEALIGADEGAPVEDTAEADVLTPEFLDAITRSLGREDSFQESCGEKSAEPVAESPAAPVEEPGAKAPEGSAPAEESAPAETVAASDEESEPEPAIQINLFLGAKMEDIIDDNAQKGLTDKDDLPTDSFKVCDPEPVKRSIDDLINQNMRAQSGIDGKRYKITKSATEVAQEEFQSIKKSIGSFNAVKDMRVGDILTTMQGLGKRGMTSIEKSYEPLIDEMVKYCDNNISPLYTAPLFKSFGLDINKLYEDLDTSSFEKARFRTPAFETAMAGGDSEKELAANELLDSYINALSQGLIDIDEMGDMDDATFKDYLIGTLLGGNKMAGDILEGNPELVPGLKEAYRALSGGKTFMREGGAKLRDVLNKAKGYNQAKKVRDRSAKALQGKGVYATSQGVTAPDEYDAAKETRYKDLDRDKMDIDAFLSKMEGKDPEKFRKLLSELGIDAGDVDNVTIRDTLYNILRDKSGVGQADGKDAPYAFKFDDEGNQVPNEYLDYNTEFLPAFLDEISAAKGMPAAIAGSAIKAKDALAKKGYLKFNDTRAILEALDADDSTRPLADKYYNAVGDRDRTAGSGMTTRKITKVPEGWSEYVTPVRGEGFTQDRLVLNDVGRGVLDEGDDDVSLESVMDTVVLPIFNKDGKYADTSAEDIRNYNKQYKTLGGGREAKNSAVNFGKVLSRRDPSESYAMIKLMSALGKKNLFNPGNSYDFIKEAVLPSAMFRNLQDEYTKKGNEQKQFLNPASEDKTEVKQNETQTSVDERNTDAEEKE